MARLLLLSMCLSSFAHAASGQIDVLRWPASGVLTIKATIDGQRADFSGAPCGDRDPCSLKENGDSVELIKGRFNAKVTSYAGFVSIIIAKEGSDTGYLFLLERKNADFEQMNIAPIQGRAGEMPKDLAYSLERFAALERVNGKDPSFAFRAMVAFFEGHPDKKFDSFADAVESGSDVVRVAPKPKSKLADLPPAQEVKTIPAPRSRRPADPSMNPGDPMPGDPSMQPMDPNAGDMPVAEPRPRRRSNNGPLILQPQVPPPPGMEQDYDTGYQQPRRRVQAPRPPVDVPDQQAPVPRQRYRQIPAGGGFGDVDTYPYGARMAPGTRAPAPPPQQRGWSPFNIFN